MENEKLNKTIKLILLIGMVVSLSGQINVLSPVQINVNSRGQDFLDPIHTSVSTQSIKLNNNQKNTILSLNKLETQKITILSTTNPNAFISTWNTSSTGPGSSNSTQIQIPLVPTGNYNFTINWGDSTINDTITNYNQGITPHNYNNAGIYTLTITGIISGWEFNRGGDVQKILQISQWGPLNLGNTGNYFYGAFNLGITATDALNLTGTTNLNYAFALCKNLGSSGTSNFNTWDTSSITNMFSMFYETAFNQPIYNWNVSKVTDMDNMFYGSAFNQPIGNWNVERVTDMGGMFGASAFNQSIDNWNVANVTEMGGMFYASVFNQSLRNWNVAKVTDMNTMFSNDQSFNQPIGIWNVSRVTNMGRMFYNDLYFNQPLDNWNVSRVTDMNYMFYNSNFDQPLDNWNVVNVTNMNGLFSYSNFNQPLDNWNVSKVINMNMMFSNDPVFNQPLGNWDVSKVTDMGYIFSDSAFNQPIGNWDVSNVKYMSDMFQGTSFNQPIGNWDVSSVIEMGMMFGNSVFNQSIDNWDVSKVTDMGFMFYDSVFNQPLGNWDVSKVTIMYDMFTGSLSVQNYDNLLIGWSQIPLQHGVTLMEGKSQFSSIAARAKQKIITNFNWTIYDGGETNISSGSNSTSNSNTASAGFNGLLTLISISFLAIFIIERRKRV